MINPDTIKQSLKEKGYTTIYEFDDVAEENFPDHSHEGDQLMTIIKGSMEVDMDGEHHILNSGDELFFLFKQIHSATMGPQGCEYLVGEKPTA